MGQAGLFACDASKDMLTNLEYKTTLGPLPGVGLSKWQSLCLIMLYLWTLMRQEELQFFSVIQ